MVTPVHLVSKQVHADASVGRSLDAHHAAVPHFPSCQLWIIRSQVYTTVRPDVGIEEEIIELLCDVDVSHPISWFERGKEGID